MTSSPEVLVLVGRRSPAIEAARGGGYRVVVVAPGVSRRHRADPGVVLVPAPEADAPERHDAVLAAVGDDPVAGVLACAEGTVAPAARLRRAMGLPGLSPESADACTDKLAMKRRVVDAGIVCAPFVGGGSDAHRDRLVAELGLPMVIKNRIGSGGRGTRIVRDASEVPERLPPNRIAEAFVHGEELSVEGFVTGGRLVWSNVTEYVEPRAVNVLPRTMPAASRARVEDLLRRAVGALGVERGVCHMEAFVTGGGAVFGELAARPPGGHLMRLVTEAYEFDAWRAWIEVEAGGQLDLPARAVRVAGVRIFHPGAGRVVEASGVDEAARVAGVVASSLRVEVGDSVRARVGAGQEVGHLIVVGPDRDTVLSRLREATGCIRLRVEETNA